MKLRSMSIQPGSESPRVGRARYEGQLQHSRDGGPENVAKEAETRGV